MKRDVLSWKTAFFSLLGLIFVLVGCLFVYVKTYLPEVEENHFQQETPLIIDHPSFTIQTDKRRLNQLVHKYIEKNESEFRYMVELVERYVQLRTSFSILGQDVPVTVNFVPKVASSGDLLLQLETFTVSYFTLPADKVLQIIKDVVEIPEWIEIYPNDKLVYAKVTNLTLDKRASFRFNTFDLVNDKIELDMTIH